MSFKCAFCKALLDSENALCGACIALNRDFREDCPICMEKIHLSELKVVACGHVFHSLCID